MRRALPTPHGDVVLLVARVVLGVVLVAHGWQKLLVDGIARTSDQFDALGIPLAIVSAAFVTVVEFVGGAMLVVGALTPLVVGLHLVVMIGAAGFVHLSSGLLAENRGLELVSVIAACELVLAVVGAGRYSVDEYLHRRRTASAGVTDGTAPERALAASAQPVPAAGPPQQRMTSPTGPIPQQDPTAQPALFGPAGSRPRTGHRSARSGRPVRSGPAPLVAPQEPAERPWPPSPVERTGQHAPRPDR